jgi:glycerate kinase
MAAAGFDAALAEADLVITGEGRIDEQTAFGKTAMGVARRAQAAGVRCLAIGGAVTPEGREALATIGAETAAAHDRPITLDEARAAGVAPIRAAAVRLAAGLRID